jgi:hypothetical protein
VWIQWKQPIPFLKKVKKIPIFLVIRMARKIYFTVPLMMQLQYLSFSADKQKKPRIVANKIAKTDFLPERHCYSNKKLLSIH